jgi:putative ABC transport system substrate-binding protein
VRQGPDNNIVQLQVAVRFSNRPFGVKRFQTIHHHSVDVIVTAGSAILATKQQTSTIPIVFAVAVDPVGSGMVESLARPGGNVTGLSIQSTDLGPKRLELLREVVPGIRRLAILATVSYSAAALEMAVVQASARKIGLDADTLVTEVASPLWRSRHICRQ